jgi:hypothetical protein
VNISSKYRQLPFDPSPILRVLMSELNVQSFTGDLEERFRHIALRKSSIRATIWYFNQVCKSMPTLVWHLLKYGRSRRGLAWKLIGSVVAAVVLLIAVSLPSIYRVIADYRINVLRAEQRQLNLDRIMLDSMERVTAKNSGLAPPDWLTK